MLTEDLFFRNFRKFCRMLGKEIMRGRKAISRYFTVWAAGGVLAAGLWVVSAGLDKAGAGTLVVYANTGFADPAMDRLVQDKSHLMTASGQMRRVTAKHTEGLAGGADLKEGRLLAGNTLAKNVFALGKARSLRQNYIEQVKKMMNRQEEPQEEPAEYASSVISYSQKDYEVLQRIVEAEAGICDDKGRILVANVIINRVKNQEFPDTITGVVYQKSQFSPVQNGTLNSCTVSEETIEAVDRALAGEDYSQGALYFMNRGRSEAGNVTWFDQRLTYLFQHEGHEFFR